jgi:hypothetical protein
MQNIIASNLVSGDCPALLILAVHRARISWKGADGTRLNTCRVIRAEDPAKGFAGLKQSKSMLQKYPPAEACQGRPYPDAGFRQPAARLVATCSRSIPRSLLSLVVALDVWAFALDWMIITSSIYFDIPNGSNSSLDGTSDVDADINDSNKNEHARPGHHHCVIADAEMPKHRTEAGGQNS